MWTHMDLKLQSHMALWPINNCCQFHNKQNLQPYLWVSWVWHTWLRYCTAPLRNFDLTASPCWDAQSCLGLWKETERMDIGPMEWNLPPNLRSVACAPQELCAVYVHGHYLLHEETPSLDPVLLHCLIWPIPPRRKMTIYFKTWVVISRHKPGRIFCNKAESTIPWIQSLYDFLKCFYFWHIPIINLDFMSLYDPIQNITKAKMISSVDTSGALEHCELQHLGLLT